MGSRVLDIDIGQTLELYAKTVSVGLFTPTSFVQVVADRESSVVPLEGLVIDAVVATQILRIEESTAKNSALCTRHLAVPANTQGVIEVDFGAVGVTVYQSNAGAASVVWEQFVGDPSDHTSLDVGTLPFSNRVAVAGDLGSTTHFRTDLDPVNARLFTVVFEIKP